MIIYVLLGKSLKALAKGKASGAIKKLYLLQGEVNALLIQPGDVLKMLLVIIVFVSGMVVIYIELWIHGHDYWISTDHNGFLAFHQAKLGHGEDLTDLRKFGGRQLTFIPYVSWFFLVHLTTDNNLRLQRRKPHLSQGCWVVVQQHMHVAAFCAWGDVVSSLGEVYS